MPKLTTKFKGKDKAEILIQLPNIAIYSDTVKKLFKASPTVQNEIKAFMKENGLGVEKEIIAVLPWLKGFEIE